jgi:hypothetical protein
LRAGLTELAESGLESFNAWIAKNKIVEMDFLKIHTKENLPFGEAHGSQMNASLNRLSEDRIHDSTKFFAFVEQSLNSLNNDVIISRAYCACICHFHCERLLLS